MQKNIRKCEDMYRDNLNDSRDKDFEGFEYEDYDEEGFE